MIIQSILSVSIIITIICVSDILFVLSAEKVEKVVVVDETRTGDRSAIQLKLELLESRLIKLEDELTRRQQTRSSCGFSTSTIGDSQVSRRSNHSLVATITT